METAKNKLILAVCVAVLAIGVAIFSVARAAQQEIKPVAIPAGPNARNEDEPEIIPPNPNATNNHQNK